jgi:taurine dioxygenase
VHSASRPYGAAGLYAKEVGRTGMKILPSVEADKAHTHPLVRTHPVTGRKALFVNRGFTTQINDLPADEGRALLTFLTEHATKPDFQTRFRWQAGSVALWDNRFTQHQAIWDYYPQTRSGFRVTVKGDRPV